MGLATGPAPIGTSHATFDAFWAAFNADQFAKLEVVLAGVGAPMTSGYNRAGVQLQLYSSAWTGSSSNNNSGNNNSGSSGSGSSGSGSSGSGSSSTYNIQIENTASRGVTIQSNQSGASGCTNGLNAGNTTRTSCTYTIAAGAEVILNRVNGSLNFDSGGTTQSSALCSVSGGTVTCKPNATDAKIVVKDP
ncbi:MAG: hypothetical protein FJW98_01660 [Actinobacteria bacterium]|nr:hypothetical protein [Actinomycetota bacterium]